MYYQTFTIIRYIFFLKKKWKLKQFVYPWKYQGPAALMDKSLMDKWLMDKSLYLIVILLLISLVFLFI